MKLKEEYQDNPHLVELYRDGYIFDPEKEIIYIEEGRYVPEKFKDWNIEKLNPAKYLDERLEELGAIVNDITVELTLNKEKAIHPIFTYNRNGDIEILQYNLKGEILTFKPKGEKNSESNPDIIHVQKRLHPNHEHLVKGKYDFAEAKNVPFWSPLLMKAYQDAEKVKTLYITEGQFKAFKGCLEGIHVVGLTSITHFQQGEKFKELHHEIVDFINVCEVEKVVVLWDGDALEISTKDLENGNDLTKRPKGFKNSALKIRDQLRKVFPTKKRLEIFFAIVNSYEYESKGLDDLLVKYSKRIPEISKELDSIGNSLGNFFKWENMEGNVGERKMNAFFNFTSARKFYEFHKKKIGEKNFVFFNTTYEIKSDVPVTKVDANLKRYKLIGTNWFKIVDHPVLDKAGNEIGIEERLEPWKKEIITLQHGKDALKNIESYQGFINVANHVNYQQVIRGKWNLYSELKHEPLEGEFPNIAKFLKHLFEEHFDNQMIYDYFSVLYTLPYEKLPVICLVSKEEGTGKSTFINLLKLILQQNMATITSEDFMGQWTSHWVDKLVVASEETFFEKNTALERIKYLSTAERVQRSERFVNNTEIECMIKFVFCSNHEDNFIKLNEKSSRFWIRKIKALPKEDKDPDFLSKMEKEMPHFLHFIINREKKHKKEDRMWFKPEQYRTEAFANLVKQSEPQIVQDLREEFKLHFDFTGSEQMEMTTKDIRMVFRVKDSIGDTYLRKIIREYFNAEYKAEYPSKYKYSIQDPADDFKITERSGKGRAFVFKREVFTELKRQ